MNKPKIVLLITFTLVVAAAIVVGIILQQRTITVTTNTPVTLLSGNAKVATIEGTKELRLKDGEYCTVAVDQKYSQDKQCFMVFKTNKEIAVTNDYSKEELSSRLDTEDAAIKEAIVTKYASLINQYTICRGELLADGSWYGGVLRDKVGSLADTGNYYVFIMKKDGSWQIKTAPNVVVSKHSDEAKDIPEKIIKSVNALEPCEAEVTTPENVPLNPVDSFSTIEDLYTY